MYILEEKQIHKPDHIECKYVMPERSNTDNIDVLILSVTGKYPDGSLGNGHAHYIGIMAIQGLQAFKPEAFILDLTELDYRWGNSLLGVLQDVSLFVNADKDEDEPFFPEFVVISEKSAGFLSLVTPTGESSPNSVFKDINKAINQAVIDGKAWLDY